MQPITFADSNKPEFALELNKRVKQYFHDKKLSRKVNKVGIIKAVFVLGLYFTPYFLIIFNASTNPLIVMLLWIIMAFGMAGVALNIIHDSAHGTFAKNRTINLLLSYLINAIGASSVIWKIQHNILHHTYTNIYGYDDDIDVAMVIRYSNGQKRLGIHRFQHIYVWPLYALFTLSWAFRKDFIKLQRFNNKGLLKTQNISFKQALFRIILSKLVYYLFMIGIPIYFSVQPWYLTIMFFVLMHLICGFFLAIFFVMNHTTPEMSFPAVSSNGDVDFDPVIHQLRTTSNFKVSRFFYWYLGGLNFHIEHHLFPNICHTHYPALSKIIKQTAIEFDAPYQEYGMAKAIRGHYLFLKQLGQSPS